MCLQSQTSLDAVGLRNSSMWQTFGQHSAARSMAQHRSSVAHSPQQTRGAASQAQVRAHGVHNRFIAFNAPRTSPLWHLEGCWSKCVGKRAVPGIGFPSASCILMQLTWLPDDIECCLQPLGMRNASRMMSCLLTNSSGTMHESVVCA